MLNRLRISLAGAVVSLLVAASLAAFLSPGLRAAETDSLPTLDRSVRAMGTAPTVAVPAGTVAMAIERSAYAFDGDEARGRTTLKRLRTALGTDRGDIYAYTPRAGMLCLVHSVRGATCSSGTSPGRRGIALVFSPGGPGYPGQAPDLPAALVGIVADDVSSVVLVTNGKARPLTIENNAIYAEVARPADDQAWNMSVETRYADGTELVTQIPDPRH